MDTRSTIKAIAESLVEVSEELEKPKTLDDILSLFTEPTTMPDQIPETKGIYFFEIHRNEIEKFENDTFKKKLLDFVAAWKAFNSTNKSLACSPSRKTSINTVAREHTKSEWLPLYVGKQKNLRMRVNEHICGENEAHEQTYAQRLVERGIKEYRISVLVLDLSDLEYEYLTPRLERLIQERLSPIAGKFG